MNTANIKSRLAMQLAELRRRQVNIANDLAEPMNTDSSEQAVEVEDDVALERQADLIAREITSVSAALDKIDDDSYGECMRCGTSIAPERLEVQPDAALCIACARSEP